MGAPGDPLDPDDGGCAPTTSLGLKCAKGAVVLLQKYRQAVVTCHLKQEGLAYKSGLGEQGFSNAEEVCETQNPSQSARAKFEAGMAKLTALGCDATMIGLTTTIGNTVIAEMDDVWNQAFFCDDTTGNPIDPNGNDAGWIPPNDDVQKCSVAVAKAWVKADAMFAKCHTKAATAVFKSVPFDEEACESGDPFKSVLAVYDAKIGAYIAQGICPPCLADLNPVEPFALALAEVLEIEREGEVASAYVCPGP
jgi:hypothetical protein